MSDAEVLLPDELDDITGEAVNGGDDIFSEDVDPSRESTVLRISLGVDTAVVPQVVLKEGGDEQVLDLNAGIALATGSLFSFDVPTRESKSYNFRLDGGATIQYIQLDEVFTTTS